MAERLGQELVRDGLWQIVEPLLPPQAERPQGGGTRFRDDRAVFTAIVYVLTTGCAWRHLPAGFGVSKATAHRRSRRGWSLLVCVECAGEAVSVALAVDGLGGPPSTALDE